MTDRILIVEDEPDIRSTLEYNLHRDNFQTESVGNLLDAEKILSTSNISLILLDLMLPDGSGLDLCRKLKANQSTNSIPIIILTAKDDEVDKVVGFELGADDYVTKPFQMEELLARLRALIRRSAGHASSDISCGPLKIDTKSNKVFLDGSKLKLTSHEYKIIEYFLHHQEKVISRTELVEHIYDQDFDRDSNTIEVFIGRLRKKIGMNLIKTERGYGYRLSLDKE